MHTKKKKKTNRNEMKWMNENLRDNSMIRERFAWELSMQPKTASIPHMAGGFSTLLSLSLSRSVTLSTRQRIKGKRNGELTVEAARESNGIYIIFDHGRWFWLGLSKDSDSFFLFLNATRVWGRTSVWWMESRIRYLASQT